MGVHDDIGRLVRTNLHAVVARDYLVTVLQVSNELLHGPNAVMDPAEVEDETSRELLRDLIDQLDGIVQEASAGLQWPMALDAGS